MHCATPGAPLAACCTTTQWSCRPARTPTSIRHRPIPSGTAAAAVSGIRASVDSSRVRQRGPRGQGVLRGLTEIVGPVLRKDCDQERGLVPVLAGLRLIGAAPAAVRHDQLVDGMALGARDLHEDAGAGEGHRMDRVRMAAQHPAQAELTCDPAGAETGPHGSWRFSRTSTMSGAGSAATEPFLGAGLPVSACRSGRAEQASGRGHRRSLGHKAARRGRRRRTNPVTGARLVRHPMRDRDSWIPEKPVSGRST